MESYPGIPPNTGGNGTHIQGSLPWGLVSLYIYISLPIPNSLHTTLVLVNVQPLLQTLPHEPKQQISSLPSLLFFPLDKRISFVTQAEDTTDKQNSKLYLASDRAKLTMYCKSRRFCYSWYSTFSRVAIRPQQGNFLFLIHLPHTISPQPPPQNTIQIVLNIFALIFFLRLGKNTKAHWYRKKDEKWKYKSMFFWA